LFEVEIENKKQNISVGEYVLYCVHIIFLNACLLESSERQNSHKHGRIKLIC